ncbi:MAG: FkbM family methyltransferase [Novosphingobium sp.]
MKTYLKQGRWGQFLLIEGDMISNYVNILGHWADIETGLFRQLLPAQGGVCIEVGANIGMHAVPLSQLCAGGLVVCYEPQRPIFHILCANLALNNRLNVRTRHAAAGEENGRIEIQTGDYDAAWNYGSFSISKGFSTENDFAGPIASEMVEIVALDKDPALADLAALNLLKIDAEGHELGVLKGAKALIAKYRPNVFVEPGSLENVDALRDLMQAQGYRGFWFVGQRYGPDDDFIPAEGSSHHDINLVFLPEGAPPLDLPPLVSSQDLVKGIPILTAYGPPPA